MQRFDLATIAPVPWKNGGGSTRELACWPPGAGMDAFEWRVSVASIARSGPFSAFGGVDRQIMLLAGDGVHLRGAGIDHRLDRAWQPFAFAGEVPVQCELLGSQSTDCNLMLRRGVWRGGIEIVRGQVSGGAAQAGLCLVLAGAWQPDGGETLTAGQGGWWCDGAAPHCWAPVGGEAPALARVALRRGEF